MVPSGADETLEEAGLLLLPVELLHRIMSHLPLSSIYQLGSTNRHLHRIIHQDDRLWRFKVRRSCHLLLWNRPQAANGDDREEEGEEDEDADDDDLSDLSGLLHDPTLQGHKELFLLYSQEFGEFLRLHREQRLSKGDQIERLLRSFLPRLLPPKSSFLPDPDESTRLALFGPGIESPHTKHLVHKVVNSHTNVFDAVSFISGLPGGFGSGVRINFRKLQTFDLMCLYTNSSRVRESQRGVERLQAGNNKLLVQQGQEERGFKLHENVLKLLPTVQALLFAIDATDVLEAATEDERRSLLEVCRSELRIMSEGLDPRDRHTPVLVLSCHWKRRDAGSAFGVKCLARHLGLADDSATEGMARPWAIFSVDIADMEGMASALDWLLYHCQKRRSNLKYHKNQSGKLL